MQRERRSHRRYPVIGELKGTALSPLAPDGVAGTAGGEIRGQVSDIGAGGVCLQTAQAIDLAAPFRCEIRVPQLPVGIPTLVQVRWTERDASGLGWRLGLQFVI